MTLDVNVAKRPFQRTHRIRNRDVLHPNISNTQHILQRPIPTRRHIQKRHRARNRPPSRLQILILPISPHSINHTVVEPKGWVTRAVE
jgi:hypothetical protein